MMIFFYVNLLIIFFMNNKFINIFRSNFLVTMLVIMFFLNDKFVEWNSIMFNLIGLCSLNYTLLILIVWIFSLVLLMIKNLTYCYMLNYLMMVVLLVSFMSINLMNFYFFFEFSLILIFFVIIYWGVGEMRLMAGFYLMFYTLFFSLPFLMFMFYILKIFSSMNFFLMEMMFYVKLNNLMYMYMVMMFMVKIPMFMTHGWLLKAHVEAPVFGSMILASIMLKLGVYGLIHLMLIFLENSLIFKDKILLYSLIGSLLMSFMCIRQIDLKIMVAYSSVVHMSLLISGLMTYSNVGMLGSIIMMISHGLCSSGMFFLVNLIYEETSSRLLLVNKGIMNLFPSLNLLWFLICSSNSSSPVSLNLVSEVMLMISLVVWMNLVIIFLMMFCFFSFLYSIYMYMYISHGKLNFYVKFNNKNNNLMNYFILLMHWIPLNFMFLNLNMFNL